MHSLRGGLPRGRLGGATLDLRACGRHRGADLPIGSSLGARLSSHVEARLRARGAAANGTREKRPGLPAGTLTGAPKIRAMEIIDEFETEKRGAVYAGAVGYFSANGEMDSCIVLRTALVKDGMAYVQAGAGIVADSDPAAEQLECQYKARALFKAAEEAVRFAERAKRGNR